MRREWRGAARDVGLNRLAQPEKQVRGEPIVRIEIIPASDVASGEAIMLRLAPDVDAPGPGLDLILPASAWIPGIEARRPDRLELQPQKPRLANLPGHAERAAEFLSQRAGDARPSDLLPFLDAAKDEPPSAGDEPGHRSDALPTGRP
jgi:hypothetical protein